MGIEKVSRVPAEFKSDFWDFSAPPPHPLFTQSSVELVIDGPTLKHILGTDLEPKLAELGSRCGSVVVCRASPSQKASIVRMMKVRSSFGQSTTSVCCPYIASVIPMVQGVDLSQPPYL